MNRRDFLRSLAGVVFAGPAVLLSAGPTILDGRWHLLQIIDGAATVDGSPWREPWLTGGFDPAGKMSILLKGNEQSSRHVEIDWVRAWKDKDREVFQTAFRAQEGKPFGSVTMVANNEGSVALAPWGKSEILPPRDSMSPFAVQPIAFDAFTDFLS